MLEFRIVAQPWLTLKYYKPSVNQCFRTIETIKRGY
nr:MAG TPA: hypothetical protein [Bacteriophage sp.]